MQSFQHVWETTLVNLEGQIPPRLLHTWVRPLEPLRLENDALVLRCKNRFTRDWVRQHFQRTIERSLPREDGAPRQLVLVFDEPADAPPAPRAPATAAATVPSRAPAVEPVSEPRGARHRGHPLPPAARERSFDRFVDGPSNRMAVAAARRVLDGPGEGLPAAMNPLFLCSNVGLGKTHLACAIVNESIRRARGRRVRFVPAERFVAEVVGAIANGELKSFTERYRTGLDLLVVDDVQFLAGKRRTQMELFHALDAMVSEGRPVILTGNGDPGALPDLNEALRSRLAGGLVVEIEPPSSETRLEIVTRRALEHGVRLDPRVAREIAETATSNVRDLIGALNRVMAFATLTGRTLGLELAREALALYRRREPVASTPEAIVDLVAEAWGVSPAAIRSASRRHEVALPRQAAIYLARKHTRASLKSIGKAVGRNHSSVLHALTAFERRQEGDPKLVQKLRFLEERLTQRGVFVSDPDDR